MIKHSEACAKEITEARRRIAPRATFDLVDPDAVVTGSATNSDNRYSRKEQVYDRITEATDLKVGTLEQDRFVLDGTWALPPDDPAEMPGQYGWWGNVLSNADGNYSEPHPYIEMEVTGLSILQGLTVWFSTRENDGVGTGFRVDIWSGVTLAYSREITGNTTAHVLLDKFTVYDPTRLRLTILSWSRPYCYPRVTDVFLGIFEQWFGGIIKQVDVYTESTFTGLNLPYSTCTLEVYNDVHRFDPYALNSIFESIEARQSIPIEWGVYLPDGTIEWLPAGRYYQQSGGWEIKDLTVVWKLVDIIGMLTKRNYSPPEVLPTTLAGWIASIVACLGVNLAGRYIVDEDVAETALTTTADQVTDKTCGEVLRFVCQAAAVWAHQDYPTGYLHISALVYGRDGARVTLDNMPSYPVMEANDDIADLTFKLDANKEVTFPGTNTESDTSLTINNPFVHIVDDARRVAAYVLRQYGGRKFTVKSRGNPASETGDIDTVDTAFGTTIAARRYKHQLKLADGVMRNLPSYLRQTATDRAYDHKVILTGKGSWKAPAGVTTLYIWLVGGGAGGDGGSAGGWNGGSERDYSGAEGRGGLVLVREIKINAQQTLAYACGKGGAGGIGGIARGPSSKNTPPTNGTPGTPTTLGAYSSDSGTHYAIGVTDVATGEYYGADGTRGAKQRKKAQPGPPAVNYGCGGSGGDGGEEGRYELSIVDGHFAGYKVTKQNTDGADGSNGADGIIVIQYEDPEETV